MAHKYVRKYSRSLAIGRMPIKPHRGCVLALSKHESQRILERLWGDRTPLLEL